MIGNTLTGMSSCCLCLNNKKTMLPTTITLNIGTPAADLTFESPVRSEGTVSYNSVSPQGDLQGSPTLRVSRENRKSGVSSTLVQIKAPQYNTESDLYDGEITLNTTLIRKRNHANVNSTKWLEWLAEFLAVPANREAIAANTF